MMQPFKTYSLNLKGQLVTIDRPWVMGIINITPDSFYSGSRVVDERTLIERVGRKGKTDTALSLLHGKHLIAAPFQIADSFLCRREVNPIDTLLST